MLELVFFDAAGTLIEPSAPVGETYARMARDYGIAVSADVVNAGFRRAFRESPPLAFGPGYDTEELRRREYRWWRDVVAKSFEGLGVFADFDGYFRQLFAFFADSANWRIDPMASATLMQLRDRGLKLGVVSNFDHRLYRIFDGLGLGAQFDSITISSEAGYAKPSPEIFQLALQKHHATANQAVHVGDSPDLDAAGALAAGIMSILLDPAAPSRTQLEGRMARIPILAAVPELIDQLAFP